MLCIFTQSINWVKPKFKRQIGEYLIFVRSSSPYTFKVFKLCVCQDMIARIEI